MLEYAQLHSQDALPLTIAQCRTTDLACISTLWAPATRKPTSGLVMCFYALNDTY